MDYTIIWRPQSDGDYFEQTIKTASTKKEALEIWEFQWVRDPEEYVIYGPYVASSNDCAIFEVKEVNKNEKF